MDSKEKARQYQLERYRRFCEEKRCGQCGRQDEHTLNGKYYCEKCLTSHKVSSRNSGSKIYYSRQRDHECTRCGVKLPEGYYYVCCEACKKRLKNYREKKKTAGRAVPNGQSQKA